MRFSLFFESKLQLELVSFLDAFAEAPSCLSRWIKNMKCVSPSTKYASALTVKKRPLILYLELVSFAVTKCFWCVTYKQEMGKLWWRFFVKKMIGCGWHEGEKQCPLVTNSLSSMHAKPLTDQKFVFSQPRVNSEKVNRRVESMLLQHLTAEVLLLMSCFRWCSIRIWLWIG